MDALILAGAIVLYLFAAGILSTILELWIRRKE